RDHYDLAQLSKTLATINRESPVEFSLEDARLGDLYTPEALALCKRLEFRQFLSRFEGKDLKQAGKKELALTICQSREEAENVLGTLQQQEAFGFHLLAEGDTFYGAALSWQEDEAFYIPTGICPEVAVRIGEAVSKPGMNAQAARGLSFAAAIDVKEQLTYLPHAPWEGVIFDCAVASYLLNPLKNAYPYDDILRDTTGGLVPSREELLGKLSIAKAQEEQAEKLAYFACYHALCAYRCCGKLRMSLRKTDMEKLFDEVEMPLVFTLHSMQLEGIRVKAEQLRTYGENLSGRISELEEQIWETAGEQFNINSPKQLGVILFEKLHMPFAKKTKTGYSTSADVLDKLAEEYPIVSDILEYRQLTKLKSTYAEGLYHFIGEDGRIHGKFNQMVTATGRISSTDPNLQNIPVRTELGRELRKVFIPKDGFVFIDADYSQIELRVLAAVSGDENLIAAYREAKDIHAITASQVFHIPLDQITAADRRNAKAVNFGIVYGISSFGLSNGLSISRKEAGAYIEQYFKTYPGIKQFLDGCIADAQETGYAVTMFGRRRPVPELKSGNFMQRSFGERVAMNSPIQGTAADIIKIAMVRVDRRLKREGLASRLILQVHDELLVEVRQGEQEQVKAILQEEMTGAAHMAVALEIEMKEGSDWFEAH
ncbi:MAG: DNA polymerase I, partial [Lachnospiraceae bacterium]|nr:DNA polymerase I [Lachnospiraceae bacterium]